MKERRAQIFEFALTFGVFNIIQTLSAQNNRIRLIDSFPAFIWCFKEIRKNDFIFHLIHVSNMCHRIVAEACTWWRFIRNWHFVDQNEGLHVVCSNPVSKWVFQFLLASYNHSNVWLLLGKRPSFHEGAANSCHIAQFFSKLLKALFGTFLHVF